MLYRVMLHIMMALTSTIVNPMKWSKNSRRPSIFRVNLFMTLCFFNKDFMLFS